MLQVTTAQEALPQLQQQASDAAAQLQPSQAQERQQGQCFAQQAPKLLQVAAALLQPVQDCQVAAQEALPNVEVMQEALKDVLGQTEVCLDISQLCDQYGREKGKGTRGGFEKAQMRQSHVSAWVNVHL